MTRTREDGARRRAEDRARRRSETDRIEAAKAAAAAAAAGATAGALRAIAARRGEPEQDGDGAVLDEEEQEQPQPQARAEPESESEPEPVRPAKSGELREIAQQARQLLSELRGVDAEAVSGLTRSAEGWVVTLEAVELRRIPESTDVLATYEVEVDERGRLLRYQRCGRYTRSQADREQ